MAESSQGESKRTLNARKAGIASSLTGMNMQERGRLGGLAKAGRYIGPNKKKKKKKSG